MPMRFVSIDEFRVFGGTHKNGWGRFGGTCMDFALLKSGNKTYTRIFGMYMM